MEMRRWLAFLIFFVAPALCLAQSCTTAICTAASASETDVLAALPSSSNTNATVVVNIPSGTAAWTTASSYTVPAAVTNLTIQGATTVNCTGTPGTSGYSCTATDNTVIQDDVAGTASVLTITTGAASTYFRLTGITLEPYNSSTSAKNQGIWDFYGSTTNFRWDHSDIVVNDSDNEGSEFDGPIEGVFDHNVMNGGSASSFTNIIRVYNDLLDSVGNGDGGWMAATQWGSHHAIFFEDNYITGGYTTDCAVAGRLVIRYNTFYNSQDAAGAVHSTKDAAGPARGCRSEEFYHNYMSGSGTVDYAATGGEGSSLIVWGNTLGTLTDYWFFAGGLNRNSTGSTAPPTNRNPPNGWALCGTTVANYFNVSGTGTSTWDANSNTATGYPCLDGFGRGQQQDAMNGANFPSRANTTAGGQSWPDQYLEPIYFWDNTLPSGMSGFANLTDESTQLNRDMYVDCDSYNSSCSSGFTGAAGTGYGTLANRPSTCTAGPGGTYGVSPTGSYGVAYWATDANSGNGELYVCTAANTWTGVYQPYTYPHPLDSSITPATGDSRTVTQPTIPPVCSQVQATKYIVSTNTVNLDPYNSTCGSTGGTNGAIGCTGGTDWEPSSTASPTYTSSETLDNTAVQNALNACASGKAVELVAGAGGQRGFVLSPWSLPTGVGVIIDAGIHVFASRNLSDYGGTNCGEVTTGTSSCNHWITAASTTGAGIYGPGELDGRGWDSYIGDSTHSFYVNRLIAWCNAHSGTAAHGIPTCPASTTGTNSYGPNAIDLEGANNFTIYQTTIRDAGNFFVNFAGGNGLTVWGAKLIGPFEVQNTDGVDPLNSTNVTVNDSYISNGDNQTAVKATSGAASNVTVSNTQTGAGIGLAIGSATQYGVSNVLVDGVVQKGNLNSDLSAGLQIASSGANGGLVNQVTFENDCMSSETNSIRLYTNYGGNSGTNTPIYNNVLFQNIHVLADANGNSGYYTFQGLSGNPITAQLNNLVLDGTNQGVASQSGVTTDQYANVTLGPGAVPASITSQFSAGTGVTTTGSAGSSTPYACSSSTWQPLIGNLTVDASSGNNQSGTVTAAGPYTFKVMLQPATEVNEKESPAPTASVELLEDGSVIQTVAFAPDGTFVRFTPIGSVSGTHTFTAEYPGDTNYGAYTFGSVTVEQPVAIPSPPQMLAAQLVTAR